MQSNRKLEKNGITWGIVNCILHQILLRRLNVEGCDRRSMHEVIINPYNFPVQKYKGKRPLQRQEHSWEGNINVNLKKVGYRGVNLIQLARVQW